MPRYFFDLLENDVLAIDEEGLDLPDVAAAEVEAARSIADMIDDWKAEAIGGNRMVAVEARDEQGPLLTVRLSVERHARVPRHS